MIPYKVQGTLTFKKDNQNNCFAVIPASHKQFFLRSIGIQGLKEELQQNSTMRLWSSVKPIGNIDEASFATNRVYDCDNLLAYLITTDTVQIAQDQNLTDATDYLYKSTSSIGDTVMLDDDDTRKMTGKLFIEIASAPELDTKTFYYVCHCIANF